jgi:hypothetical protein
LVSVASREDEYVDVTVLLVVMGSESVSVGKTVFEFVRVVEYV